jgi:acetoin utilization protein AcuB
MTFDLSAPRVEDSIRTSFLVLSPQTTVATALRLLREHGVPGLPVWDRDRFVEMMYETDLLRLTPSEASTLDIYELREVLDRMTVRRAMAPAISCAAPGDSLAEGARLLLSTPHGVIPVVSGDRPVGLLTWADVLSAAIRTPAPSGTPDLARSPKSREGRPLAVLSGRLS